MFKYTFCHKSLLIFLWIFLLIFLILHYFNIQKSTKEVYIVQEKCLNVIKDIIDKHNILYKKYLNLKELKNIEITAYSPCKEETDMSPNTTAIMEKPIIGYTCAVSRDLKYMLGKKIYIENIGVYKVNDLMNKRYSRRIDLCMNKKNAIKYGIKKKHIIIIN